MSYTLSQFLEINIGSTLEVLCGGCTGPGQPEYRIDGEPHCRECYFDKLGYFIERHPIYPPHCIQKH